MKLLGRGLRTGATHNVPEQIIIKHVKFILVQVAMKTPINYRPVTKTQPFKPTLYKLYCLGLLTHEPNIILGSLRIESLQLAPSVGKACVLAQAVGQESPPIASNHPLQCPNIKFHQGLRFSIRGYASNRQQRGWFQGLGQGANPPHLKKISKFWTKPRYCMVLGLKPMGKPTT